MPIINLPGMNGTDAKYDRLIFAWNHLGAVTIKNPVDGTEPYAVVINRQLFHYVDMTVTRTGTDEVIVKMKGPFALFNFAPEFNVLVPNNSTGELEKVGEVEKHLFYIWNPEDVEKKGEKGDLDVKCGLTSYTCNIVHKKKGAIALIRSYQRFDYELIYSTEQISLPLALASALLRTYAWNGEAAMRPQADKSAKRKYRKARRRKALG